MDPTGDSDDDKTFLTSKETEKASGKRTKITGNRGNANKKIRTSRAYGPQPRVAESDSNEETTSEDEKTRKFKSQRNKKKKPRAVNEISDHNRTGNKPETPRNKKRVSKKLMRHGYEETGEEEVEEDEGTKRTRNVARLQWQTTETDDEEQNTRDDLSASSQSTGSMELEAEEVESDTDIDNYDDVGLNDYSGYSQKKRLLLVKGTNSDRLYNAVSDLWVKSQCRLRFLKGTYTFRFERKANTTSGGALGSSMSSKNPFRNDVAMDVVKTGTMNGVTRYAIKEKVFMVFTGFLEERKTTTIKMVSALVRCLQPRYGVGGGAVAANFVEDNFEGLSEMKIRWADIDDIWNDMTLATKLIKYFISHGVSSERWIRGYRKTWSKDEQGPIDLVKWNATEDL